MNLEVGKAVKTFYGKGSMLFLKNIRLCYKCFLLSIYLDEEQITRN